MLAELPDILVESAIAYAFIVFFVFVGRFFLQKTNIHLPGIDNSYGLSFYSLVFGLLIVICVYSVIVTRGVTINILIIPLLAVLIKGAATKKVKNTRLPFLSILQLVVLGVIILHLFPESEYKQNDSFYYLKIAEAMNRTGQENTHGYYNIYSDLFHGTEPYHYFEIWCTAFITSVNSFFYSSIQVHRYIVQAVFLGCIILGLYNLVAVVLKQEPKYWHKIFCWSLVFFMPDLLSYFPAMSKYFISNLEGNLLDRPNYRILYVLLIALVTENLSERPSQKFICFWLVLLGIVSFKFALLILPAIILFALYRTYIRKESSIRYYLVHIAVFALCFILFYLLTGVKRLPTIYNTSLVSLAGETMSHWKFVLFSIFASAVYIILAALIFIVPLFFMSRDRAVIPAIFKKNSILILLALTGLIAARVLFLKDNAYQFLFAAHIICFLLVWLIATYFMRHSRTLVWITAAVLFTSPLVIRSIMFGKTPDVFEQNGSFVYQGKKYSAAYINGVTAYMRKNGLRRGAYLADSSFYSQLYYSRRNPNVYFLPISYIVSNKLNAKFETCISDSAAIMTGIENPVHRDYLDAAIQRSFFYQYRKQYPELGLKQVQAKFITDQKISYLFVTKDVQFDMPVEKISRTYTDAETGERFIVLKPY